MSTAHFQQSLKVGAAGESVVSAWLQEQGFYIQPAYEKIGLGTFKGPRTFGPDRAYVSPDLFCLRKEHSMAHGMYVEVKAKRHFTYYGKKKRFETGIDTRLFHDYLELADRVGLPVYLMFLHWTNETRADDVTMWNAPPTVQGGLFWGSVTTLDEVKREGSMAQRGAIKAMYYWGRDELVHADTITNLEQTAERWGLAWPPSES
jgi:hypothetical protein